MPGPLDVSGIVSVLQSKSSAFEDVMKALDKLQSVAEHPESFILKASDVTDLRSSFISLANDNRSKIVVKTCKIIQLFSENLKNSFDRIASNIFPTYLEKVSSGITVISSSIAQTCLSMTKNIVMKTNITVLIFLSPSFLSEKVADTSIQCLEYILKYWPSNVVDSFQTIISLAIVKAVSSYSERVRVKARSIVLLCDKDYPGLASIINSKLPASRKKGSERGTLRSQPSVSPRQAPSPLKTLKPRSSASVSRSLSSFKQNDRLFTAISSATAPSNTSACFSCLSSPSGYPDKANQNLFVGLLLDQRIDSKFDGVFLDRKLFDCSPGYGLLTVASSIFPIDDLQANGSLRRNGSLQKIPTPLPRRSALVTRSPSSPSQPSAHRTLSLHSTQSGQSSVLSTQPAQSGRASQPKQPSQPSSQPKQPKQPRQPSLAEGFLSVDDCITQHKLLLFNAIKSLQAELRLLVEFEEVKEDHDAVKAYKRDVMEIRTQCGKENSGFMSKLARLEVWIVC
ncbi:uncharacterized protein [Blastocystis hominis]|uniref:TOG domain-containing protein n=1 Tax=Blastocystis hominis TaxID=12968 RepID=D8M0U7_BLAHO|nr:uncharacterized protein [Blastocystis hominis]CBK21686.2 unnamed protein product [Blastocystis hominis]|eukprot:XP_012895734.1 uncharacterized protein [Blastocystis hominis]